MQYFQLTSVLPASKALEFTTSFLFSKKGYKVYTLRNKPDVNLH